MYFARLFLAGLVLASVPALPQQPASSPAEAIARVRTEWAKDLHEKRLDRIVMLYAPDAVFLAPSGQRVTGREAIRELTKQAMSSFTSDLTFQSLTFDSSGALAYDSGEFHETLTGADGNVSHDAGNYVMVFKRQSDGTWLIVEQAWIALLGAPNPS